MQSKNVLTMNDLMVREMIKHFLSRQWTAQTWLIGKLCLTFSVLFLRFHVSEFLNYKGLYMVYWNYSFIHGALAFRLQCLNGGRLWSKDPSG